MLSTYNLADIWEATSDLVADRTAVVFGDRRLTYADIEERAVPADPRGFRRYIAHGPVSRPQGAGRPTPVGGMRVRRAHAPWTNRTSVSPPSSMCRARNPSTRAW